MESKKVERISGEPGEKWRGKQGERRMAQGLVLKGLDAWLGELFHGAWLLGRSLEKGGTCW